MAKWIGYLGGGAAGAAVAVAGYIAWTLYPDPEAPRETPAALAKPENGAGGDVAPASPDMAAEAEKAPADATSERETGEDVAETSTEVAPEAVADPADDPEAEKPDTAAGQEAASDPDTANAHEKTAEPESAVAQEAAATPETVGQDGDPVTETVTAEAADPETDTTGVSDAGSPDAREAAPEQPATQDETPDTDTAEAPAGLLPPTFDLVRIEPDGSAIVAGAGSARAQVRIFLDGGEIGEATSGRDGRFVSLLHIPPSRQPRLMTLAMSLAEEEVFSKTEIIVAPFGAVEKPEPEQRASLEADAETAGAAPEQTKTEARASAGAEAGDTATLAESIETAEIETDTGGSSKPEAEDSAREGSAASDVTEVADATVGTSSETVPAAEKTAPEGDRNAEATSDIAADAERPVTASEGRSEAEGETSEAVKNAEAETDDPAAPEVVIAAAEPLPEPAAEQDPETSAMPETDTTVTAEPRDSAPVLPEPQAPPRLLASDDEGVRVLPGPEVLDRVAIDSISYDTAGDVALAGRGVTGETGGFVRVYLDNTPITTSRIRSDGSWWVTLPEIDKGVYTLRVDEVDDAGEVKSRAETPFLREDRETLEEASEASAEGGPVKIVTVQPGNTLWQIARERYGEGLLYVRVFDANKGQIRDPDLIYPGQVFDLPEEGAAE
ncbi:LysM peptidoglycan-binding domain-containing protein [Marinovum sp.]|uniref:LysM peptidoglycan-binding domain-containing protein n=1 Tax=Marinovum sp. TaxID=2024839 RepID=UPI003A8EAB9C